MADACEERLLRYQALRPIISEPSAAGLGVIVWRGASQSGLMQGFKAQTHRSSLGATYSYFFGNPRRSGAPSFFLYLSAVSNLPAAGRSILERLGYVV